MARKKKTSDGDNLKVVELPKPEPIFVSSDGWLEISQAAMELALHAAQTEIFARQADKVRKLSDELVDDFIAAKKLREAQKEIFMATLKKFLG